MKTYILNLERSVERRERMEKMLSGRIEFEFLKAVDANQPEFPYQERRVDAITRKRFGYRLTDGELACFASHHLVWEKCLQLNEPILVLEDNCDISEHFFTDFSRFNELAHRYHFLKLAIIKPGPYKTVETLTDILSIVRYHRRTCSTACYIVTPRAAKAFIENASQFIEPVDEFMEKPYKHGISTYCVHPTPASRTSLASTIGARKDKTGITWRDKVYIELYRLYEQFREKTFRHQDPSGSGRQP